MWDGLISGGLSLLGGLFGQSKTDDRLEDQMAFQAHMSNTAYQRAMADMRKAGLNPMLAYSKGGASTPTGAFSAAEDILTPAVNSAQAAKRLTAEIGNMEATNKQIAATTENTKAQTQQVGSNIRQINAQTQILNEELEVAKKQSAQARHDQSVYETPYVGRGLRTINTILHNLGLGGSTRRGTVTVRPTGD